MAISNTIEAQIVGRFIDRLSGPADKAFKKVGQSAKKIGLEDAFDSKRIARELNRINSLPIRNLTQKLVGGNPFRQGAEAIDRLARGMEESLPSIKTVSDEVGFGLEGSIGGAIRSLRDGFGGLEIFATRSLNRIQDRFFDTLANMATNVLTSGLESVFGSIFSTIFIPGFAHGGEPPVGRPVIVGEEGPEIFIPRTRGTIVSNHRAFASGVPGVTASGGEVKINVNVIDRNDSRVTVRGRTSGNGLDLDVLIDRAVARNVRRGGDTHNAFRETFGLGVQTVGR